VLTYTSVALAYTPLVVKQAIERDAQKEAAASSAPGAAALPASGRRAPSLTAEKVAIALVLSAGFILALPVLMVAGSFPAGLISAVIIFIGMRQAWRMTAAPTLRTLGPYRVGATPAPTPA